MNAIVAVCDDWAIGKNGQLLVRNKADMHRFVELTTGGTVIMGRKTFESFPGGPLKGRRNIIVTRQASYQPTKSEGLPEGTSVEVVCSPEAAVEASSGDEGVWLIGGDSLYKALLPQVDVVFVTLNHTVVEGADAFFPRLDEDPSWKVTERLDGGTTKAGIPFEFVTYTRA